MNTAKTYRTPIVNSLLWITAVHLAVSAVIFIIWRVTGDDSRIELFFTYQGSLFTVLFAAIEVCLAWIAFRQFSPGEPLRAAWLLITFASVYRFTGYLFSQILDTESHLNPIYLLLGPQNSSFYRACQSFGLMISGPLSMAVLAVGLFSILRTLRRLGLLARLRRMDFGLLFAVVAFTAWQAHEISRLVRSATSNYDLFTMVGWSSDPLLSILLIEAILIWRSVTKTGWGLLAKSWGAFSLAIFLTLLGDLGIWVTWHNYLPYPYNSINWFVWFLVSAAYVLGPAYQVEACRHAYREAEQISAGNQTPDSIPD
jgi:hypothetical protein